jgi:hypothetical protein
MATVLPSIQPVINISNSHPRFPAAPRHRSQQPPPPPQQQQLRYPQQVGTIRCQSLPSSHLHLPPPMQNKPISTQQPPVAVVPPSQKPSPPSLQITLTNNENERKSSSKANISNTTTRSSSKTANETVNSETKHLIRSSNHILVGGGSRSAFRPFLKQTTRNPQPRIPSNTNLRPTNQIIQK